MKIIACSTNPIPGDVAGNLKQVLAAYQGAADQQVDLVVFPEFALLGYPIDDLIRYRDVLAAEEAAIEELRSLVGDIGIVIGVAERNQGEGKPFFNSAFVIRNHAIVHRVRKANLPTYGEFDESRWFEPGTDAAAVFDYDGQRLGVIICEDIWVYANRDEKGRALYHRNVVAEMARLNPDVVISINASPYWCGKRDVRLEVVREAAQAMGFPIVVYTNRFGGQDELVFDGANFALGHEGQVIAVAAPFRGDEPLVVNTECSDEVPFRSDTGSAKDQYDALVLAVRDYARKSGFPQAVLGLSGGIDSALTLTIAADALGAENVQAVMMPFRYTSVMSQEDAAAEARALGVRYSVIAIEPLYDTFVAALAPEFADKAADVTEENLQARIRGTLLMSLSNKFRSLVLTTGNKSEMAVGYATLYGDMAGGFAVLKDVPKTDVYALARYRNGISQVIPESVITRAPSAELAPGQVDQDSLPAYDILDAIVDQYIVDGLSASEIVASGFDAATVERVISMVCRAEYKRRQAPPGPKVTKRGLSPDAGRRVPITYRHGS